MSAGYAAALLEHPLDLVGAQTLFKCPPFHPRENLIAAIFYDAYAVGPSILPMCTSCYFTMTSMIQVS